MTTNKIIMLAFSVVLFASCNDNEAVDSANQKKIVGVIEVDTTDVFGSDAYEFVLPRPFALAASFQEAGMTYSAGRTNPVENVTRYKTKGSQLINFGVYSTDLVYNILNDQPQQTMKYFQVVKELAEKFGMGSIFTEDDLALEIEKNISDRDELEYLLVEVHERSQEYLEDNDMRYLAAIQFSGAWIEGMYLVSYDIVNQDPKLISHKLSDQMSLVRNTIHGLEVYPNRDESINKVLERLKGLENMFNNFESVKATGGVGFPQLTEKEIQRIAEEVREIRAIIVEP